MRGLRHHLTSSIEDRAREVAALLDVGRERTAAQRHSHLLGNRAEAVIEDLERDRVDRDR